jgi:hypothetical protein
MEICLKIQKRMMQLHWFIIMPVKANFFISNYNMTKPTGNYDQGLMNSHFLKSLSIKTDHFVKIDGLSKHVFGRILHRIIDCAVFLHNHVAIAFWMQYITTKEYMFMVQGLKHVIERKSDSSWKAGVLAYWDLTLLEYITDFVRSLGDEDFLKVLNKRIWHGPGLEKFAMPDIRKYLRSELGT